MKISGTRVPRGSQISRVSGRDLSVVLYPQIAGVPIHTKYLKSWGNSVRVVVVCGGLCIVEANCLVDHLEPYMGTGYYANLGSSPRWPDWC